MKEFLPRKLEKDVISMRIDTELLRRLDHIANEHDISRNTLLVQCVEFALENYGFDKQGKKKRGKATE